MYAFLPNYFVLPLPTDAWFGSVRQFAGRNLSQNFPYHDWMMCAWVLDIKEHSATRNLKLDSLQEADLGLTVDVTYLLVRQDGSIKDAFKVGGLHRLVAQLPIVLPNVALYLYLRRREVTVV